MRIKRKFVTRIRDTGGTRDAALSVPDGADTFFWDLEPTVVLDLLGQQSPEGLKLFAEHSEN